MDDYNLSTSSKMLIKYCNLIANEIRFLYQLDYPDNCCCFFQFKIKYITCRLHSCFV